MKFIRKNGRVIPIRDNAGGQAGRPKVGVKKPGIKPHVQKKKSYPKVKSFGVLPGAAIGAALGAGYGKLLGKLNPKGQGVVGISTALFGGLGAAAGSLQFTKKAKGERNKHLMERVAKTKVKWF